MNPYFSISNRIEFGDYGLFYTLAFVIGAVIVFYEGYRRKWPLVPWLAVIGSCLIGAIIGSKLATIPVRDLFNALSHGFLPLTTQKTYLGGILGGVMGIGLARRLLGFRHSVMDAFSVGVPIALAVGRLGCLLGGCCFGVPTNLPWGVQYASGSTVYGTHVAEGLISPWAATSLSVHPTPIYEIVFSVAFLVLLWRTKHFLKAPGNSFYFYVLLYGVFRFLEEFIRASGETAWGLKPSQWGLALAVIAVAFLLFTRERRWVVHTRIFASPADLRLRTVLLLIVTALILWLGWEWFSPLEVLVLNVIAIPIGLAIGVQLMRESTVFRFRWATASIAMALPFVLGFATMNQTKGDTSNARITTVSVGGMYGQYEETCGPVHTYMVGGVGLSQTRRYDEFRRLKYGGRFYLGNDRNGGSQLVLGLNPYVQYDWRWLGIGLNAHTGRLVLDGHPLRLDNWGFEGLWFAVPGAVIFPSLRLGPYDKFFLEARIADHFPGSFPAAFVKLGLGIGFQNRGTFRLGLSDAGFYFTGDFPMETVWVTPFFAAGDAKNLQMGLTVHYQLNR